MMQLKIAHITNLTDARFFNALGADYLGFCLDALQPDALTLAKAKEIAGWLHAPHLVGSFGTHQSAEEIAFMAEELGLQEIEIPLDHPDKGKLNFTKFLQVHPAQSLKVQSDDFLVLSVPLSQLDDPAILECIQQNKVFLDTPFTRDNIREITERLQPYGIQLSCGQEEKPGWSRVDEYAEMLELIGYA